MNIFFSKFILLLAFFASSAWGQCAPTISCNGSVCKVVADPICAQNIIQSTTNSNLPNEVGQSNDSSNSIKSAEFVAPNASNQNPKPSTTPSYLPGCAENGSCYGDISNITGKSKTTNVNGYYRRDGTYVRGHYRSR